MTLRIGTRGSALALAQTGQVAAALTAATGEACELVVVTTHGDTSRASLASLGGTGVFAGALRTALADGRCDLVVHSLKDLPVAPAPGLTVAAVPVRADARDAVCGRLPGTTLAGLRPGAAVGTGSPRRRAQLLAARPDLHVVDLRGNVDTRLARTADDLDAVLLSAAGLHRLGRDEAAHELLPLDAWPTAAGQGALALEVRSGEEHRVAVLDDADAHHGAAAERAVLGRLEAGCTAPVGVASEMTADGGRLWAAVLAPDGSAALRASAEVRDRRGDARGPALLAAAVALADDLLARGAHRLALDEEAR